MSDNDVVDEMGIREPTSSVTRTAVRVAWTSAGFTVIVLALMIANSFAARRSDPLKPASMHALELRLNREPNNEALRKQVRAADLALRRNYVRHREFALTGVCLLAGGVIVFLVALEAVRRTMPAPTGPRTVSAAEVWLQAAMARRAVVSLGAVLGGTLVTMAVLSRHDAQAEYVRAAQHPPEPRPTGSAPAGPAQSSLGNPLVASMPVPSSGAKVPVPGVIMPPGGTNLVPAQVSVGGGTAQSAGAMPAAVPDVAVSVSAVAGAADNWPSFRGPGGIGIAPSARAPETWDGASGKRILWKKPVPLPGWNSPIVWQGSVYLVGADKTKREVYCFDLKTGELRWRAAVPISAAGRDVKVSDDTGYCPATLTTDGTRICAVFVTGDVACVDSSGKLLWVRALGVPDNHYGHSTSPLFHGDRVIVQFDQGSSADDGKSVLLALDAATGKTVWQTKRAVGASWATPIIIKAGTRDLVVVAANPWLMAYDVATGVEVWRAEVLGGEVAPTPVIGAGFVISVNQGAAMAAVRPGGTGNVTKSAVAWKAYDGLPDIVSPLCTGDYILLCTTEGFLTCVDTKTGSKVWEHDLEIQVKASPVLAGGRVLLVDAKGATHVLELGREFREISVNPLGEDVNASPAVVDGRVIIRGKQHLYCIGEP